MIAMTAREMLDAIREGLDETALLIALGYDPVQGRPGRHLLNNALERLGFGRPIDEQQMDRLELDRSYPDEWMQDVAEAVIGRRDATVNEVVLKLRECSIKVSESTR